MTTLILNKKVKGSPNTEQSSVSQTSLKSYVTTDSCKSDLRIQLSAVAWVQCDNTDCLKWRKVSKSVADALGEDDTWICSMNKDPDFNSCSVPEEDTAAFDKLAKLAKLSLIKSELKQGTLVWARIDGFCRWPAMITVDPLNNEHVDGDDEEVSDYHVEFLGEERSHCWVSAKRVEVFGTGNKDLLERDEEQANLKVDKTKGRKKGIKVKGRSKISVAKKSNPKKTYKGNITVQKAVAEALKMLPWTVEQRLETSWFVPKSSSFQESQSLSGTGKLRNFRTFKDLTNSKNDPKALRVQKTSIEDSQSIEVKPQNGRKRKQTELTPKVDAKKTKGKESPNSVKMKSHTRKIKESPIIKKSPIIKNMDSNRQPTGLGCLSFPSSLIGSSKEERFILDVQMYIRNEKAFEEDVSRFMSIQGLLLSPPPVWHNVKISLFGIFLAVYERGGFELVCDNHQWGSVYSEVTHNHTSKGNSALKMFYHRNLYAYELYVTGQDYTLTVRALQPKNRKVKKSIGSTGTHSIESSQPCSSVNLKTDEEDVLEGFSVMFDGNQDVCGKIDTLDEILQMLGQDDEENNDHQVPYMHLPNPPLENSIHDIENTKGERVDTGSKGGDAVVPEEKAQVVPELDFPSSEESSQLSNDFHELQALQMNVNEDDELIDILH